MGLAIALIDHGRVRYVHAYGLRNEQGDPLTTDTVMYGASLTKMVFSYQERSGWNSQAAADCLEMRISLFFL